MKISNEKKIKKILRIFLLSLLAAFCIYRMISTSLRFGIYTYKEPGVVLEDILIPAYESDLSVMVHENIPLFTKEELMKEECYSDIDNSGRCVQAMMTVSYDTLNKGERADIRGIEPSGWNPVRYEQLITEDNESGNLFNRCHLLADALGGDPIRENLITGTRALNEEMLKYEMQILEYCYDHPDYHVAYRVTPLFTGENKICDGVLMEAYSIESRDICFCVFVYNVQPGIEINYYNGDSKYGG